jgi:hypothetical protein
VGKKQKKKDEKEKGNKEKEKEEKEDAEEEDGEKKEGLCLVCKIATTDLCFTKGCGNFIHEFCGIGPEAKKKCGNCR